jgi:hypothetical protein
MARGFGLRWAFRRFPASKKRTASSTCGNERHTVTLLTLGCLLRSGRIMPILEVVEEGPETRAGVVTQNGANTGMAWSIQ